VCGPAVHFVAQRAVMSRVQEGEMAFTFGFRGKLNGLVDAV
jgi:hypothetical protein